MKRLLPILLVMLLLTGCAELAPAAYSVITEHAGTDSQRGVDDAETAEDYGSLKKAILSFVNDGAAEGRILVSSYDGNVEEDLTQAAYEVSKLDPIGAYAVDYMTHDCVRIVSYYEIHINTTFRRTKAELSAIRYIGSDVQLRMQLQSAVERSDSRLTIRLSDYQEQDMAAIVEEYCRSRPDSVMEKPKVTWATYPDSGKDRIVEINFQYTNTPERLKTMEEAVLGSVAAAAEYIRYRQTEQDKAELLFTYLTERFSYVPGETATPLYHALCSGIADPVGLAQAWQQICNRAGVQCYTVEGVWGGETRVWNIVSVDGYYRHIDLARSVLELEQLTFWTDEEMTDYYWNTELYPACEPIPEPEETEPPVEEDPETDEPPAAGENPEEEPSGEDEPPVQEEPASEEPETEE